jgi:hypothetical protein
MEHDTSPLLGCPSVGKPRAKIMAADNALNFNQIPKAAGIRAVIAPTFLPNGQNFSADEPAETRNPRAFTLPD